MTVSSEINKSGPYTGNGSNTVFDFEFKIQTESHVQVIITNEMGAESILAEDKYQVFIGSDGTGHITLPSALPAGHKLTLLLNPPFTQLADLPNQGAWNPDVVEAALDKLTCCLLKLREEVSRSVKIKTSNDLDDMQDLQTNIDSLAEVASDIKALNDIKSDLTDCANHIEAIANAEENAATTSDMRNQVAEATDIVLAAKLEAQAARDEAKNHQPISASAKGRELIAKTTVAEMREVLSGSSNAFYGLKVTEGRVLLDTGSDTYTASDYFWSDLKLPGATFEINMHGHLVATA